MDVENLSKYGKKIGIAFQLIDDLIGIYGDSKITGKAVGNDIREGKKTFPILLAIQNIDSDDKIKLEKVFGNKNASDESINEVVNRIAINRCRQRCSILLPRISLMMHLKYCINMRPPNRFYLWKNRLDT